MEKQTKSLQPLHLLPRRKIRAVFTDLDDTLTTRGKLSATTLACLEKLHARGLWLCVVSGRPAGWGDCLMRLLPLDALIFENGAGLILRRGEKIQTKTLGKPQARLFSLYSRLKREMPYLKLATDQPFRRFDLAIDFAEEPPRLSEPQLERLLARLSKEPGITHKLSSIHVNLWTGAHTKRTACRTLLRAQGFRADEIVFCGDSPNDEPLFAYFPHSVGVANVRRFLPGMKHPPRYITPAPEGKGFSQLARFLLSDRKKKS